MAGSHPTEEVIAAFALGKLDDPAAGDVAAHLEECPECRAAAGAVTADGFVGQLQAAHGAGGLPHDPNRTVDVPPPAGAGTVIAGRYKLLQPIGEGGMGSVWMAEQTEPVKRKVAVKLIRTERGSSRTILSRFEAERQAIALMDHPHIAKLLDAGAEGGAPFFVMELVRGLPLAQFCDAHRLSVPDRLALFVQVCSAVQHAHQKGVIHRDLKPSNVLVESHDGKPVPKVIDFGLAKAASGLQLTEHTLFTRFGSVMGTPLYMAPEQATFNAVDVDTRADVYALGVILYELLTGTTPLTRDTIKKAALDEMLRLIREQEPPTPSRRLSSSESEPSVAANRQTEPTKLGRLVKGELDWIVLKALAKDRDRRYESATGFARDVERFLNHEPVTAGPPTVGYKLRKFARRNRGLLATAALVTLTLLVGAAGTVIGSVQASREREGRLTADRDRLRDGLTASARIALQQGDVRRTLTVLDELEAAGFPLTPELRLERAKAHQSLGDEPGVERELAALDATDAPAAVRTAATMLRAELHVLTDFAEADELFREAEKGPLSPADREYVRGLRAERSPDALAAFQNAVQLDPRHLPARQMVTFTAFTLGRLGEAAVSSRAGVLLYPDHPTTAILAGLVEAAQGNTAGADAQFDRVRDKFRGHPLATLAFVYRALMTANRIGQTAVGSNMKWDDLRKLIADIPAAGTGPFRSEGERRTPPCFRACFRLLLKHALPLDLKTVGKDELFRLLRTMNTITRHWTQDALDEFKRDLDRHPEGYMTVVYGNALSDWVGQQDRRPPPTKAELAAGYAAAAAVLREACHTPMTIDQRATALDAAVLSYVQAANTTEDLAARRAWGQAGVEALLERLRTFGLPAFPEQSDTVGRLNVFTIISLFGERPTAAWPLLDEWARLAPNDAMLHYRRARVEEKMGHFLAARADAARALAAPRFPLRNSVRDIFDRSNAELVRLGAREMLAPPRPAK